VRVDWAIVYRETYADLVRFLHRKVWDADQARDLAQETFVRALDHDPDNPRAFVFTIAANLARDEARAAVRRKKHLALIKADSEDGRDSRDSRDSGDSDGDGERMALVRRALEQLSERDREALLLWDAGFSYPEIAAQTGLAVGAVGTTLARARKKLVDVMPQTMQDSQQGHG
jgi:RNA polymerase sigma-70 factor (ECF subfamily)